MQKRYIILLVLSLVLLLSACGNEPRNEKDSIVLDLQEKQEKGNSEPENFIDLFDIDMTPITPDTVGEDEYRLRFVIEARTINSQKEVWRMEDEQVLDKYGVEDALLFNDLYENIDLSKLRILLDNKDFLDTFENEYGYRVKSYHLPKNAEPSQSNVLLGIVEDEFYFAIAGEQSEEKEADIYLEFVVIETTHSVSINELAKCYAEMDDLRVETAQANGNSIFYFSGMGTSDLFYILRPANEMKSIYLWEQDGVIGILAIPGEHTEENLDRCILERIEL